MRFQAVLERELFVTDDGHMARGASVRSQMIVVVRAAGVALSASSALIPSQLLVYMLHVFV